MSKLKPGDVVVLNDIGVHGLSTFPHMKTLRSIVRSVDPVPGLDVCDVEVCGFDGQPNELTHHFLLDIYFDKVA